MTYNLVSNQNYILIKRIDEFEKEIEKDKLHLKLSTKLNMKNQSLQI